MPVLVPCSRHWGECSLRRGCRQLDGVRPTRKGTSGEAHGRWRRLGGARPRSVPQCPARRQPQETGTPPWAIPTRQTDQENTKHRGALAAPVRCAPPPRATRDGARHRQGRGEGGSSPTMRRLGDNHHRRQQRRVVEAGSASTAPAPAAAPTSRRERSTLAVGGHRRRRAVWAPATPPDAQCVKASAGSATGGGRRRRRPRRARRVGRRGTPAAAPGPASPALVAAGRCGRGSAGGQPCRAPTSQRVRACGAGGGGHGTPGNTQQGGLLRRTGVVRMPSGTAPQCEPVQHRMRGRSTAQLMMHSKPEHREATKRLQDYVSQLLLPRTRRRGHDPIALAPSSRSRAAASDRASAGASRPSRLPLPAPPPIPIA